MEHEIVDLVSEEDEVIAQIERSQLYLGESLLFRVVNGFIVRKSGHLWIPRRSASKKLFPKALDASIGGHVKAGETYLEAFYREAKEEVFLDLDSISFRCLGKLTPQMHGVSAFMHLYEIPYEEEVVYEPLDFEGYEWMLPSEVLSKIEEGEQAKNDLKPLVQFYLHHVQKTY